MATLGLSKVFILDKYFTELQKFWETEKKLQDASSSNEAVHLQQRLRSLSTELVTLRNRLHVGNPGAVSCKDDLSMSRATTAGTDCKVTDTSACTTQTKISHNVIGAQVIAPPSLPHSQRSVAVQKLSSHDGSKGKEPNNKQTSPACNTTSKFNNNTSGMVEQDGNKTGSSYDLEDLIRLPGPLTEDAVMKSLQTRFVNKKCYTNIGPILVAVNSYNDVGNCLTLTSTRNVHLAPQLRRVVQEAVRQQSETGYPQAIILSGTSGSGKTYTSMLLLRQLFEIAGGGPETDAFKHLAAAFTVLRSLGSAKTTTNSESSRIGQFIEVQVTDGALYRTKIHCYFLDQTRVIRSLPQEKNYHIFYQMLAGLSREERIRFNLDGYNPTNLRYLQAFDTHQNQKEDSERFQAWKACLSVLGIPFLDVVRVLSAVLLLGNVIFVDGKSLEVSVKGETELNSVANLLGVPGPSLFRGLTSRTHNARGQLIKSVCDANMSNMTKDSLAKALYCRTVATIVRRANSLKRLGSTLGTLSSDSNESVHNQAEVTSQHASTVGGNSGSKSMVALNNAVRHATDGFIGILDMFGFEEPKSSQLEHLCINLCAETMQHFYNTHIFKSSVESCRDENIQCDIEVDYVDNVPCIDLISSLRTGLLSMLDVECSIRGTAESYIAKVKVQHKQNDRLFEPKPLEPRLFGIQHFAGKVIYDATDFLDINKDVVPDDLVATFHKHTCDFGFASHLFGSELKALYSLDIVPRGISFRISPTSHTDLSNGDEPISTLTQDFHTRLDNLLRTLVHARPHFVRCIRSNATEASSKFEKRSVMKQIRYLQVLETVNLMASGYPHRMRFKAFISRYRLLAPFNELCREEDNAIDDCKSIMRYAIDAIEKKEKIVSMGWDLGKRHIFLSEGIRQYLENLRSKTRNDSATMIQSLWRGWRLRRRWIALKRERDVHITNSITNEHSKPKSLVERSAGCIGNTGSGRPRPQPIAGTPPPDPADKCDTKVVQQTCTLFGLDLERPPPVPPSRSYTVAGNSKLGYPQTRVMKMTFPEELVSNNNNSKDSANVVLRKGDSVLVIGASHRRGHLIVEHNNVTLHVPYQFMELVKKNFIS
ncbi:unconventional myosin-IXb [Ctenocephalides felis]|uniref:unconventional myosin-IXb n=1 Tax=Ctenocephalides felis TaxID=7515 RepID=UPI000E6E1C0E|nr:unconventional myosin-IXb [Ctenocephalides felis]